jgi:hypothetical protein
VLINRDPQRGRLSSLGHGKPVRCLARPRVTALLKPCVDLGECLGRSIRGPHMARIRSMTIPQEIAVSLIVAVCAAATGRLAWSVVEFVYWVLN